jgi:hypothetical protein
MSDVLGTVQDLIASKGTKIYLCEDAPTMTGVEEDDLALFDALTWIEIGMVESVGEFGPEKSIGSFTPLGTGIACKFSGTTDNGELSLSIAKTVTDAGLIDLIDLQGDPAETAFKLELSKLGAAGTGMLPHRYCFNGLVRSARITLGTGDDVVKVSVAIPVTGDILEGAAVDGT